MSMDAGNLPPSIPFHVARAYGPQAAAAARPAEAVRRVAEQAPVQKLEPVSRLVAATVPGRVDFRSDAPQPGAAVIQMYRHPADKNQAATAIQLGRSLDVSG